MLAVAEGLDDLAVAHPHEVDPADRVRLATAVDVTLAGIELEAFLPADEPTARWLRQAHEDRQRATDQASRRP